MCIFNWLTIRNGPHFILLTFLSLGIWGCGNKSKVSPSVEARRTAEAYGDGEHLYRTILMPLSDNLIDEYESPMEKINYVAGGFARMFMNIGTSIGLGRAQLTMFQPVPEIPKDFIKGAKIKRVFFYIEPTDGDREKNLLQKIFIGRADVNYNFLDKLAIKISPHNVENVKSWIPYFETRDIRKGEYTPLQSLFENDDLYKPATDEDEMNSLVIVKYSEKNREKFLRSKDFGSIFILNAKYPIKAKRFLEEHPKLSRTIKSINVLFGKPTKSSEIIKAKPVPGTLLVELVNNPNEEELFQQIVSDESDEFKNIGIRSFEKCTQSTCLDFKLPDVNILPLITKGNAVKIDAFMDARKVPESFQLKGFIEFEVKFKLPF